MSILSKSIRELNQLLIKKELSVKDLADESLHRIKEIDPSIKAFLTIDEEGATTRARQFNQISEDRIPKSLLFGIPAGIKDNIVTHGVRTTCASQLLANYDPIYQSTVMKKLEEQSINMIGKLNMDEFAMGSSTENSGFHPTYNPWHLDYVPGGSSGGSAAAVAADEVVFALGSDTGGSIRQPAAYCGVVGLKPTYGLVSRFGLVAFASSLDQIGPLTHSVEDAAIVLHAIAGHDHYDSTSAQVEIPNYVQALTGDIKGLRVALPKEYFGQGISEKVREKTLAAIKVLEQMGATVEEVSLPHSEYAISTYYLIASSEASSNLARFDGVRYGVRVDQGGGLIDMYKDTRSRGFGAEVKRRILLGTYALSSGYYDAYYIKAQKVRTLIKQDFDEVFKNYDVIIGPTTPTPAFKIASQVNDPLTMYLNDILTIPVNLAGVPAISIPCGLVEGLPIGLQIIGKPFAEATILNTAYAFEQQTEHHLVKPNLTNMLNV